MGNRKVLVLVLVAVSHIASFAQKATIKGVVTDEKTKETLPGTNVLYKETGVVTDFNGNYTLEVEPGDVELKYQFIGFEPQTKTISIGAGETKTVNVVLTEIAQTLGTVVVTGGKFEQKLEEVTMSMDVIRPSLANDKGATNIQTAVNQSPGVQVVDNEPQIRGGSGFNFGAGSRVMVLVDDIPLLSGNAGRPKWSFLPLENLEQIEILKGAASVLYGSAALSGVINVRTAYPGVEPKSSVNFSTGIYDSPRTDYAKPWSNINHPTFTNMNFFHSRQIGNLDLVWGGNLYADEGFIGPEPCDSCNVGNFERRIRTNLNLRWRNKKVQGLNYGINSNYMINGNAASLILLDVDSGLYTNYPGSQSINQSYNWYLDPFINYVKENAKHSLRSRWFHNDERNNNNQSNSSDQYFFEYQFSKKFTGIDLNLTTGIMSSFTSSQALLYIANADSSGNSSGMNNAAYLQLDKKFGKLSVSTGARFERFVIDGDGESRPVFRAGLNYPVAKYTFLRASWGQGYRFPTIAERYITTQLGPVRIFANPNVRSENSWNAEIGLKQAFKIKDFKGFFDIAVFRQEVTDAIEFNFGNFGSGGGIQDLGFKSINVSQARIQGLETSIAGRGKIGEVEIATLVGYTLMDPQNLDPNAPIDTSGFNNITYNTSSYDTSGILKYRFTYMFKGDIQATYKKFSLGFSYRLLSNMKNLDRVFFDFDVPGLLPTGISQYWENKAGQPEGVLDTRLKYQANDQFSLSFIVDNTLNNEYMIRPLKIEKPRTYQIQMTWSF